MTTSSFSDHRIFDYDALPPFFMTLVNSGDLWAFLSTTGGLTAGRRNEDHALFPYTTDDRITESAPHTGPLTLIRLPNGQLWQPFSTEIPAACERSRTLFKSIAGDRITFEEIRRDPDLVFRYTWMSSPKYGLVRKTQIQNQGGASIQIETLDGVQNLLPAGATSQVQREFSNLLDAYKRNFLEAPGTLALFTLSSKLTDLAEPSEALRATVAWSIGDTPPDQILLSSDAITRFRRGLPLKTETDVCARRGAYLLNTTLFLPPGETRTQWQVFDTDIDHTDILALQSSLQDPDTLRISLEADLMAASRDLHRKMAAADALQCTGDGIAAAHHFTNVTFNCMRGGLFPDGPRVRREDLRAYLDTWRRGTGVHADTLFRQTESLLDLSEFQSRVYTLSDPDAQRLCRQYLPLTFSRRHGDPSRPWNKFDIRIANPDGSPRLDFQGNWRDLFQNLEALLMSCPDFLPAVIATFLNATTLDGYNPYRVTRSGFEWEKPEPDNPWANIGYWGDHQLIYLLKLLEAREQVAPGTLTAGLNQPAFSSADIPYRILPHSELVSQNDGTTVRYDHPREETIEQRVQQLGADGKWVHTPQGCVHQVSLMEKLLVLTLAKLGNFVPGGGIWMNTQRPEWNDANNALAGRGLSRVTLGYLHRTLRFIAKQLRKSEEPSLNLSPRVADWLAETHAALQSMPNPDCSESERRQTLDRLGQAASVYREHLYAHGPEPSTATVPLPGLLTFLALACEKTEETLRAGRRGDGLYHAYDILTLPDAATAGIRHLAPMLEGQVSILSSGVLSPEEALNVCQALRTSSLYREDQQTYLLYPDRRPARFMDRNLVTAPTADPIPLLRKLEAANDSRILRKDLHGNLHFHADFRNARDLEAVLDRLAYDPEYAEEAQNDRKAVLDLYEQTFDHQAFTGRSGAIFSYEGLGSIYWHMVAKLLLAVQEVHIQAETAGADPRLLSALRDQYIDIRDGLGFRKSPAQFGAFPTDPYSHTPFHGGAKQPGMTGQVKEEILTRFGELGLRIRGGCIHFSTGLTPHEDWRSEPGRFHWLDVTRSEQHTEVPANAYAFTFNQVCVQIQQQDRPSLRVHLKDSDPLHFAGSTLTHDLSASIFNHQGRIHKIEVGLER